jgi:Raf kinase inhibitor-like YbhB/YbcL family protein
MEIKLKKQFLALGALLVFISSCDGCMKKVDAKNSDMKLDNAFLEDGKIPAKYTCDKNDISPPLSWSGAPANTASFALIVDDPDANSEAPFVHWLIWNIPRNQNALAENIAPQELLSDGSRQGLNQAQKIGYKGPCPPSGSHDYHFKLYALDTMLQISGAITKEQLLEAMKNHVLAEAVLVGAYSRP